MDEIQKQLIEAVSGLHEVPQGAYNFRINGNLDGRNTTENIDIITKQDKPGIDIKIKPGTKNESLHIPVILSQTGLKESVYNDFFVGEDCDITIVAGCGIHNSGDSTSEHSGIHSFYVGKNSKVKYIEKHYGQGDGNGQRIMNPSTYIELDEGAYLEMDTVQIKGIDSTNRKTTGKLGKNATLVIKEKIMTHGSQKATTDFSVELSGENSGANIISRSVAKDDSEQIFYSNISGNAPCNGHSECDAIIMDTAKDEKRRLLIDLETYSSVELGKTGVYKYAESDDFEILLQSIVQLNEH